MKYEGPPTETNITDERFDHQRLHDFHTDASPESCQTSKIECFARTVNS